jgi:cellulose synthase/poly-beta-1,6-N-acetylglucosamine synthase-like glycosyltransferase
MNLVPTLKSAADQLGNGNRILVVADNCTDDTAAVARSFGVDVLERTDSEHRGKGYALAFGRDSLRKDPPDVVIVLDADCTLGPNSLQRLSNQALIEQRPVQAAYRMVAPDNAGPNRQVAAFAFLVKNVVRPGGLKRFGQPCLLTGTGMAFPWLAIREASLAHGHIVEDMALSIDLALDGRAPVFVDDAEVWGVFPVDDKAAGLQRKRWEHGHLSVLLVAVPRLFFGALLRRRVGLAVLALEVGVPPLSALVMVSCLVFAGLLGWALAGGPVGPAVTFAIVIGLATIALFNIWLRFGRTILPARSLVCLPWYALRKAVLYLQFVTHPQKAWVRTSRKAGES